MITNFAPILPEDRRPLLSSAVKSTTANLTHGQTITLLDTTGSPGPGNLEKIQIYVNMPSGGDRQGLAFCYLSISIDGEGSPSIQVPLAQLWPSYVANINDANVANLTFAVDELGVCYNDNTVSLGGYCNLFCPYNTSVKVTLTNISAAANTLVDSQVYYRSGSIPAWRTYGRRNRLRQATSYTSLTTPSYFQTVNALANIDLCNISGRGELYSLDFMLFNNVTSNSQLPLEGAMQWYVDGGSAQQALGTEDFFGNQVYGAGLTVRTDSWGLATNVAFTTGVRASQWWRRWGIKPGDRLPFNSAFRLNWTNGLSAAGTPPQVIVGWNLFYFTDR